MNRRRSQDQMGWILILGSAIVLAIAAATVGFVAGHPGHDPVTLCSEANQPTGHLAVLLDYTDSLSDTQRHDVVDRLNETLRSQLRPGQSVSVWVLGDFEEGSIRRVFTRCYPGREAHGLMQNPKMVAAACDSLFFVPLNQTLRDLPPQMSAARSPILAAIREVSDQSEFAEASVPRVIVLVSDLMENTEAFSLYKNRPDFRLLRASGLYEKTRADLRNVAVHVLYVGRRGGRVPAVELMRFWREYFMDCAATAVHFHRL